MEVLAHLITYLPCAAAFMLAGSYFHIVFDDAPILKKWITNASAGQANLLFKTTIVIDPCLGSFDKNPFLEIYPKA
jgi:hypothetical protein